MTRSIDHRYDDPLDLIWLDCARSLGLSIVRSTEVYASFDGAHTLTLSTAAHFDPDDCLAQLIFHELCHALVAGKRMTRPDWGMENIDARDLLQEHACHRLQAALADRHGLRGLFAVTTEHRTYWDALPIDTLGPGEDPAIPLARDAFARATDGPWAAPIARALARTAELAATMRALALPADSLWRTTRPLHASGFPEGDADATCGDCAWSHAHGSGLRCRQARAQRRLTLRSNKLAASMRACVRFEPRLADADCADCGACCREGFDRVELRARDAVHKRYPQLVSVDGFGAHLPRPDGRCVALVERKTDVSKRAVPRASEESKRAVQRASEESKRAVQRASEESTSAPYRCRIYEDRPRACADFPVGGEACLDARRRVGLSV